MKKFILVFSSSKFVTNVRTNKGNVLKGRGPSKNRDIHANTRYLIGGIIFCLNIVYFASNHYIISNVVH